MSKIILQPCGNKDAREHYVDTIVNLVSLERIKHFISEKEHEELMNIYPSGECPVWGVTPGGSNISKWNKISIGDVTLFSRDNKIFASAVTTHKLHNKALAASLWDKDLKGQTWEYIYFLDEIHTLDITYKEFNKAANYADNYVIQGFNVLKEDKSADIMATFDLESDVYVEEITKEEFNQIENKLEALEETEQKIKTHRRLEQSYLKQALFGHKTIVKCGICQIDYPSSFIVTAHIKKRAFCDNEEKRNIHVVMPMCKFGCDDLFEKGYIAVENGKVINLNKKPTSTNLETRIEDLAGKECPYFNKETEKFFEWHKNYHSS